MHPPSADVAILRVQLFDLVSRILKLLNWDESELETRGRERHQGPRRKVLTWQIIVAPFAGRFSQCVRQFFGMTLSDSALSQRRQQGQAVPGAQNTRRARSARAGVEPRPKQVGGSASVDQPERGASRRRTTIELFARRWDQEVFYRELKLRVAAASCCKVTPPRTCSRRPPRCSWPARWLRAQIAACALPPRRSRSRERKIRQPVIPWPRMMTPTSVTAPAVYQVTRIA
jgi:hypothetical protein